MLSVEGLQISDSVMLNMECVQSLTAAIDPADVHAACTTTRHPLKFANQTHEMSFMGLWRLLDFETFADQQFVKSGRVSAKEMAQVRYLISTSHELEFEAELCFYWHNLNECLRALLCVPLGWWDTQWHHNLFRFSM